MKDMKFKCALFALFALYLLPNVSAAATAVAVTDNTGLFVINFDFIAGAEDYLIPIGMIHGLDHGASSTFGGFKVFSGENEINTITQANAVTLSKQEIVDGLYYKIAAGKRAHFTTVALAEVAEDTTIGQYHAELSHLPYIDGNTHTSVSRDRVAKFSSDTVILNKEIIGKTVTLSVK